MSNRIRKMSHFALLTMLFAIYTCQAFAADDVFGSVTAKAQEIFQNLKTLVFVLGGFGLIGFSVGAIFGKVQWKWFATLSFGLFIISVADQVVSYITADGSGGSSTDSGYESAFGDGGLKNIDFGDTW
ncbi:MAG: TrbC/VirB2 family protein [Alphaproteobacteria bacterium]